MVLGGAMQAAGEEPSSAHIQQPTSHARPGVPVGFTVATTGVTVAKGSGSSQLLLCWL